MFYFVLEYNSLCTIAGTDIDKPSLLFGLHNKAVDMCIRCTIKYKCSAYRYSCTSDGPNPAHDAAGAFNRSRGVSCPVALAVVWLVVIFKRHLRVALAVAIARLCGR